MDTRTEKLMRIFTLAVVTALSVPAAQAQQADTSKWVCEYCPFEKGQNGDIAVGATAVNNDSAYFGNATGYGDEGGYLNIDGEGSSRSDSQQLRWTIEDLALDSRYLELDGGNQGKYDYRLAYRDLPQQQYFTTETIFTDSGGADLGLPGGWVRAPLTTGFTQLNSSLFGQDIESDRSLLEVGGRYLQSQNISFSADFSRQEVDGNNIVGAPFFFRSSLLPGQFDYVTDDVDLGVHYAADAGYLSFSWRLSEFESKNAALRWQNPFTSGTGADSGALAQAPDNSFQQLSLSGAYRFTKLRTALGFTAAAGRMEQNEAFLPYTTNTNLNAGSLPEASLNGNVNTTNLALTLNSNVTDRATVSAALRYDERDNRTEQVVWTRVITDDFVSSESETNTPYSYERFTFNLRGDYDFSNSVRASAGYDYRRMDRDFQEVTEQTENGGWGGLRWRPNGAFNIDLRGGASQRDINFYNEALAIELDQNPLMRKYQLAYRERYFGELTANISPLDSPFSLTLSGLYADDDYSNSSLGLTDAEDYSIDADLSWSVSEKVSTYLSGGYQNVNSAQLGSEQFAAPDWRATNDDTFYTFGAGFRVRQIRDKVDLQLDYIRSDGTSEINIDSASKGFSEFPDLTSTLDYVRLSLAYQYSERIEFTTRLLYQSFATDDWSLQGVGPATIPTVLSLGAEPYDDDQFIVGLGFRYRIGEGSMASGSRYPRY